MNLEYCVFLLITGLVSGLAAGFLGVGGAIISIPLLLYVPECIGLKPFGLHLITGITALQATFSTASSAFFHRKSGIVNNQVVLFTGIGIAAGALFGSIFSKFLSERTLLIMYALFLLIACILLFLNKSENVNESLFNFSPSDKTRLLVLGLFIGSVSGALGLAGSVMFIPVLNYIFRLPIKTCISTGTNLALISSGMSLIGKFSTGQFEIYSSVIISVSSILGAYLGYKLNKITKPSVLRVLLIAAAFITLVRVCLDLVH